MNNVGFIWFDPADSFQTAGKRIVKTEAYLYRRSGAGYSGEEYIFGVLRGKASSSSKTLAQAVASLSNEKTADAMSLVRSTGGWGTISNAIAEKE